MAYFYSVRMGYCSVPWHIFTLWEWGIGLQRSMAYFYYVRMEYRSVPWHNFTLWEWGIVAFHGRFLLCENGDIVAYHGIVLLKIPLTIKLSFNLTPTVAWKTEFDELRQIGISDPYNAKFQLKSFKSWGNWGDNQPPVACN